MRPHLGRPEATPDNLSDEGYRIEYGHPDDAVLKECGPELIGRYWWTWCNGISVEASYQDWDNPSDAIEDARRDMKEHVGEDQ